MVKKTLLSTSLSLAFLAFLPPRASAQVPGLVTRPPCERGAIYVGGSRTEDAYCIDRRYQKMQKAQHWEERAASRNLLRQETRRTAVERTRTTYLHPNVRRVRERGGFTKQEVLTRQHSVPMTEREVNVRSLRKTGEPGATRQDRSPRARQTPRSKQAKERANVRHSRLRDRMGE